MFKQKAAFKGDRTEKREFKNETEPEKTQQEAAEKVRRESERA